MTSFAEKLALSTAPPILSTKFYARGSTDFYKQNVFELHGPYDERIECPVVHVRLPLLPGGFEWNKSVRELLFYRVDLERNGTRVDSLVGPSYALLEQLFPSKITSTTTLHPHSTTTTSDYPYTPSSNNSFAIRLCFPSLLAGALRFKPLIEFKIVIYTNHLSELLDESCRYLIPKSRLTLSLEIELPRGVLDNVDDAIQTNRPRYVHFPSLVLLASEQLLVGQNNKTNSVRLDINDSDLMGVCRLLFTFDCPQHSFDSVTLTSSSPTTELEEWFKFCGLNHAFYFFSLVDPPDEKEKQFCPLVYLPDVKDKNAVNKGPCQWRLNFVNLKTPRQDQCITVSVYLWTFQLMERGFFVDKLVESGD